MSSLVDGEDSTAEPDSRATHNYASILSQHKPTGHELNHNLGGSLGNSLMSTPSLSMVPLRKAQQAYQVEHERRRIEKTLKILDKREIDLWNAQD